MGDVPPGADTAAAERVPVPDDFPAHPDLSADPVSELGSSAPAASAARHARAAAAAEAGTPLGVAAASLEGQPALQQPSDERAGGTPVTAARDEGGGGGGGGGSGVAAVSLESGPPGRARRQVRCLYVGWPPKAKLWPIFKFGRFDDFVRDARSSNGPRPSSTETSRGGQSAGRCWLFAESGPHV